MYLYKPAGIKVVFSKSFHASNKKCLKNRLMTSF